MHLADLVCLAWETIDNAVKDNRNWLQAYVCQPAVEILNM